MSGMSDFKSTKDAIDSLTSREREVLMERFGIREMGEKATDTSPEKPPGSDDNGGTGGTPAPANPLR